MSCLRIDAATLAGGITMIGNNFFELDRLRLAQLGREMMLFAQFNSRTGYAALRMNHGDEAYQAIAIDNWMGASPCTPVGCRKRCALTVTRVSKLSSRGCSSNAVLPTSILMCALQCSRQSRAGFGSKVVARCSRPNRAVRTRSRQCVTILRIQPSTLPRLQPIHELE